MTLSVLFLQQLSTSKTPLIVLSVMLAPVALHVVSGSFGVVSSIDAEVPAESVLLWDAPDCEQLRVVVFTRGAPEWEEPRDIL